jgi:hypothetical protein
VGGLALLALVCGDARSDGVTDLPPNQVPNPVPDHVMERRIDDPLGWWQRQGFAAMVPSIHLPTTHDGDDLIQVWLSIPNGARIDAERLRDSGREPARWSLVLPPGTRADRAEYSRVEGPGARQATQFVDGPGVSESDWTLMDVRGTRVLADGTQEFHVLRPINGEVHAPLRGWAWRRGDLGARREATERLIALAREARRPIDRDPMDSEGLAALRRLNDCARCHQPRMPRVSRADAGGERSIERASDNLGFFVITTVLSDSGVVADHRPDDLNHEDPFVQVRCGDQPARLTGKDNYERFTCPDAPAGQAPDRAPDQASDQGVPVGYRDVAAGLAAGHPYTRRLCESRRWLAERMTSRAREAYREALAACGISRSE